MYVVTYHDFGGSTVEAAQPESAWLFPDLPAAEAFIKVFIARCRALNPTFEKDSEFLLLPTPIEAINGAVQASNDDLFDAWLKDSEPYWLDLGDEDLAAATEDRARDQDRKAREEAVREGWKKTCLGCQPGSGTMWHDHGPAWGLSDDELLAEERKLGIGS